MYPPSFRTSVEVQELQDIFEGASRPGHFRGVATVVAKLFNAFTPDRAYFGQKDAQQVAVIQRMARDLNFPADIVVCPTRRERDGLAGGYVTGAMAASRQSSPGPPRTSKQSSAGHGMGRPQRE